MICLECGIKINLSLYAGAVRQNGLHEICSVFLPLKYPADKIFIEKISKNSFELDCNWQDLRGEHNLLYKTWKIFCQNTGYMQGFKIYLQKNIPVGSGMGGGSSNAGAFLKYLNSLLDKPLAEKELLRLALNIGSDVPFFLDPVPALVKESGEKISKIQFPDNPLYFVLVWPEIPVSTASVFQELDRIRLKNKAVAPEKNLTKINRDNTNFSSERHEKNKNEYYTIHNDLEIPAFAMYPALVRLKDIFIRLKANFAGMSGSGSTIFGGFVNINMARMAVSELLSQYRHVYFAKWPSAGV